MTNQSTSVRFLADELEPNHEGRISSDMVPVRSMLVPTMRAADVVEAPAKRKRSAALWITLLLLAALTAALTLRGFDFYRASTEARLDHPDYRVLSPTGFLGQGYGVVGTGLILLNLLYLVRRRLAWLPLGSMTAWLNMHVFTGLSGTILVIFHSAFRLRSPVASVTAISLAAVVLTGVIGRYLFALSPTPGQVRLEERLTQLETIVPSFVAAVRMTLASCPATTLRADPSLLLVLATVPSWLLDARRRRRAVRAAAKSDAQLKRLRGREPKFVKSVTREIAMLAAKEVDSLAGSALLRTWRSIHRFMATLMLLAVAMHIGVAWHYGYRWILSH